MIGILINILSSLFKKTNEPQKSEQPSVPPKIEPIAEPKVEPKAELPKETVVTKTKKTINEGSPKKPDWEFIFDNAELDSILLKEDSPQGKEFSKTIKTIKDNMDKYKKVEAATGVPALFIAAIHYRECSLNFKGCLHNGDPWNKKTVNVPKGRGPWSSWEEAAIDSLRFQKLDKVKDWSPAKMLAQAESYNGIGYRNKIGDTGKVEYSPYVTAFTNFSDETSKYTSDGSYDPSAKEKQFGVLAIILGLSK